MNDQIDWLVSMPPVKLTVGFVVELAEFPEGGLGFSVTEVKASVFAFDATFVFAVALAFAALAFAFTFAVRLAFVLGVGLGVTELVGVGEAVVAAVAARIST